MKDVMHWYWDHTTYPPPIPGKDAIIAAIAIASLLLAYAYFVLKWATDRVKDLESLKDPRTSGGSAMLTCWIAGVGLLMSTMLGAHILALAYLVFLKNVSWFNALSILCMVVTIGVLWVVLIKFLLWYFHFKGALNKLPPEAFRPLVGHHPPLCITVALFVLSGILVFFDFARGNVISAVFLMCYQLCAAFGIGGYASLRGDIMPRVTKFEKVVSDLEAKLVSGVDVAMQEFQDGNSP